MERIHGSHDNKQLPPIPSAHLHFLVLHDRHRLLGEILPPSRRVRCVLMLKLHLPQPCRQLLLLFSQLLRFSRTGLELLGSCCSGGLELVLGFLVRFFCGRGRGGGRLRAEDFLPFGWASSILHHVLDQLTCLKHVN